jgi:uncharacterized protein (DUF302 family)
MTDYGYSVEVPDGYDEAVIRTRLALKGAGFSIITEAHVGGMLGPEAGSARQYLIMGAYGAATNRKDVADDLEIAVHLPCNVVIQETENAAVVAALDPQDGADLSDEKIAVAAVQATDALRGALAVVAAGDAA